MEGLLPGTCLSEMPFSLSRSPPSTKSGVGVYQDRGVILTSCQPCLSLDPSPHKIHSSCLVGTLGWKHGWNRPNGCNCPQHEDESCLLQCLILTFLARDMQRLKWAFLVTVATQYGLLHWKEVKKIIKTFPPLELAGLVMGKKKSTFRPFWPKLWGFKVQRIKKRRKSPLFRGRFGGRLTFWPAGKKRYKSNFFSPSRTVTLLAWWWAHKNLAFRH